VQTISNNTKSIGRFAPSPTGPLHFGSLVAAVASYLCARQHSNSQWLLRIEDVDTTRRQQGATRSIIHTLEAYGFQWDGDIVYQSQRSAFYQEALERISEYIYPCSCSRKDLKEYINSKNKTEHTESHNKHEQRHSYTYNYPGLCRNGVQNAAVETPSIRLLTKDTETISFQDECQTTILSQSLETEVGDFILKRRDGLFAYHLAVVVDDHLQGVNHIVRGSDLFDNTPRQIYLQQLLGYLTPKYLHFPVITTRDGKKLSKQNSSPEISIKEIDKLHNIHTTLNFLGQKPPSLTQFSNLQDLWQWAINNFDKTKIPKKMNTIKNID